MAFKPLENCAYLHILFLLGKRIKEVRQACAYMRKCTNNMEAKVCILYGVDTSLSFQRSSGKISRARARGLMTFCWIPKVSMIILNAFLCL